MSRRIAPQDTVEKSLALAAELGADGCVVIAEEVSSANLRWAGNTLTTNGLIRSRTLTVVAFADGAQGTSAGVVTRTRASGEQVAGIVRAAVDAARGNEPAEDAAPLIESPGDGLAGVAAGWADEPAETSMAVFADLAPALGTAFGSARAGGRELFGFAEHDMTTTYLGSSTGLRLRHVQPNGRFELNGKSDGRTRSAWAGVASRDFTDVDVATVEAEVRQRLDWAARQVELPPGRYETLLPPTAIADLMIYLYWSAAARDAHDGRTVFSKPGGGTRVGETLTPTPLRLRSDPAAPGLECQPFVAAAGSSSASSVFDNGLPLGPTDWIRDGQLTALLTTRHTSALTGLAITPVIDNLLLELPGATRSLDEMIASTERGLLLNCLWYIREVDPQTLLLTGLTRDGVFLIEGGEVVGGVNNFRFNESPVDLLARVAEVGASRATLPREWNDWFTRTAMPPVRVPDFNMSTASPAS
jgi:predicted Zn-dependent protease